MFNSQYYEQKKQDLIQKSTRNVRRLIEAAVDFVQEDSDIGQRVKEIDEMMTKSRIEEAEQQAKESAKDKKLEAKEGGKN